MKAWQLRIIGVSVIEDNTKIFSNKLYLHFPTDEEIDEFIDWASKSENVPMFAEVDKTRPYKVTAFEREIVE